MRWLKAMEDSTAERLGGDGVEWVQRRRRGITGWRLGAARLEDGDDDDSSGSGQLW